MKHIFSIMISASLLFAFSSMLHAYNTKGVIAYPMVYYPGYGVFQIADLGGMPFNKVSMKIYNIEGDQVYSNMYPGYPAIWDGRDKDGDRVDPGVYIVKVQSNNVTNGLNGKKTMSILVGGGSRGTFTRAGWVGAKYIAMGMSGEVIADDIYSIYWNPAGLTELRHTQIQTEKEIKDKAREGKVDDIRESDLVRFSEEEKSFTVQAGLAGSLLASGCKTGFAGTAINLPKGVLGVGVYIIYNGDIDERNIYGLKTGELNYLGSALYLSYGVSLGIASFGFSIKGLFEKVGNINFLGTGVDVGTQVYVLPILKVGLMLQDLGTGMYPLDKSFFVEQRYNFGYPTLRLGIALITNRNFTLSLSGIKKLDQKTFGYSVGAQYDIEKWVSIYIGMHNMVFSAGLTAHLFQVSASYAFTLDIVNKGFFNHIVSVSVLF